MHGKRTQALRLHEKHRHSKEGDCEVWVFAAKNKAQLSAKMCDKAMQLGELFSGDGPADGQLRKVKDFR